MLRRDLEELQRNVNEKDDYTIRLAAEAAKEFDIQEIREDDVYYIN